MLANGTSTTAEQEPGPWAWYAVWTHSHCEQSVYDQLVERGFRSFLPIINVWSRRRGVKRLIQTPMFPSYLFLRHQMDKGTYLDLTRVKGVVRVLGERWDRLSPIPDDEIESIEKAACGRRRILPFPYMAEGQRARITAGPLSGVEGILVESRTKQGLLVLSVNLLQRSVAVVVDGTEVTPA
jgi:transcription antitermination factor NusG